MKNILPLYKNNSDVCSYADDDKLNENKILNVTENDSNIDINNEVKFHMKLNHETIKEGSEGLVLPLLTSLYTNDLNTQTKANIDIICLIDKSGSMKGQKLDLLKKSFSTFMEYLSEDDRMSIVTFNSFASRLTPLIRMTPENKKITLDLLSTINANGGTSIGSAFYQAMEIIKQRRYSNSVTSIIILSDGLDNDAESEVKKHLFAYEGKINPIFTINSFGYGSDHDPKMMSALSDLKDGSFNFIDKLDTVDEVFVDCLGGLISVVAQNVKIEINVNGEDNNLPGIRIQKVYGIEGFWKEKIPGIKYEAECMQLISGKKNDYIFELFIPKFDNINIAARTFLVARGICLMKANDGSMVKKECECAITFSDEEDEDDEYVSIQLLRVKVAETIKLANYYIELNDFEKAESIFNQMKNTILLSKFKDLEYVKNLLNDLEKAINNAKPEVYNNYGKHYLLENMKANMQQISNKNSSNTYSNKLQSEMISRVKMKK